MSCPYSHLDGAYVLGSLSPAERLEFEQHLTGCRECARNVRELAGLPGLLKRVDADVLEDPVDQPPVPDTLLPRLLRDVRRSGRRRLFVTAGVAAAAAAAVVTAPFVVTQMVGDGAPEAGPSTSQTPTPVALRMTPVGDVPARASLAFQSVTWGTKLDLTCTYEPPQEMGTSMPDEVTYKLVVHTRDGHTEQVGTWRSPRGETMRLTAATASRRADISSVEVRTADGLPVLALTG
ncbi:MAG: zf-HC2 domain-containing protein [Nocardioidaceae bacterium]|nr:zf-HC2 domain-containing protein [Nocardioidaceae bacterium]NUS51508.1 zf-HC2 domain-containing protein [Nocardioidaceae bacterium]